MKTNPTPRGDGEKEDQYKLHMDKIISVSYTVTSTEPGRVPVIIQISNKYWLNEQTEENVQGLVPYSHKNRLSEVWAISLLPVNAPVILTDITTDTQIIFGSQGCSFGGYAILCSHLRSGKIKIIMICHLSTLPTQEQTVLKEIHLSHLRFLVCVFFSLKHNELVRVSMVNVGHHGN